MDKPIVIPNDTGPIRTVMITPTKFYDTVSNCKYNVPHFFQLERYTQDLLKMCMGTAPVTQQLCTRFSSQVSMK